MQESRDNKTLYNLNSAIIYPSVLEAIRNGSNMPGLPDTLRMLNLTLNYFIDGKSPLMLAAELGNIGALQTILQTQDLDVNAISPEGYTALHCAAMSGNLPAMLELLLTPNVNVSIRTPDGLTASELFTPMQPIGGLAEDNHDNIIGGA